MAMIKYVTFDCYGTLFDWRHGIGSVLESVLQEPKDLALQEFFKVEQAIITRPGFRRYSEVLKEALEELMCRKGLQYREVYGDALVVGFAKSPPFPDLVPGLKALRLAGYGTAIISNTERRLIEVTLSGINELVDEVVTAEDIGKYKPDKEAFVKALKLLGVKADEVVHVSAYTYYDLIPASKLGIRTVLVDRGYGEEWSVKISSLEELAPMLDHASR
jgi:2-haloalkanoic acid dehalogenase type II